MLSLHNVIQLTNIMFYYINDFKKDYLVVEFIITICPYEMCSTFLKQSALTEPEASLASRGNPATGGGGGLSRYNVLFPVNVFSCLAVLIYKDPAACSLT